VLAEGDQTHHLLSRDSGYPNSLAALSGVCIIIWGFRVTDSRILYKRYSVQRTAYIVFWLENLAEVTLYLALRLVF
jgi:hypothetical protein